jgi:hypothetical protein
LTIQKCDNVTKPILTNAYLCNDEVLNNINAAVDDILAKDFDPNELEELVLELMPSDEEEEGTVSELTPPEDDKIEIKCGYYFVNHKSRSIRWLEDYGFPNLLAETRGANSLAHISMPFRSIPSLYSGAST